MRKLILVLLALALAGCASVEQKRAENDEYCRSLGAAKGSPQYIDCRLRVMEADSRRRAAAAASISSCTTTGTGQGSSITNCW